MKVFITGITGTLGTALAHLHHSYGDHVSGCARSEERAIKWLSKNKGIATLLLADAVNLAIQTSSLGYIISSVDRVYHCAALKHVDLCEDNPHEAFLQNTHTTCLLAEACQRANTELIFPSSDKACLPQSVYGATKLLGERAVISCGGAVTRLGNLIGSSGSVFRRWAESDIIELTDPDMTRFFMTVENAAHLLSNYCTPGRLILPRLNSARIGDVVNRIVDKNNHEIKIIGRRAGETQHQWLDALPDTPENAWSRSETAPRWDTDALLQEAGVV